MRAGWRSSCPPRWRTWRTGRTAGTGYRLPSRSPTAVTRSPPRRPAARSAMTSATTRRVIAGTSTRAGRPPRRPSRPWTSCASTRSWRSMSTTGTSRPPPSRPTATSSASRPPSPSDLAGLPASTRDGRLRAAITTLIAAAKTRGARAIVIENLNFAEARAEGRERAGTGPRAAGAAGPSGGWSPASRPARFRDRLTQMAANAGLHGHRHRPGLYVLTELTTAG